MGNREPEDVHTVEAMENPITAIFDLADDVSQRAPKIKKMVKYAIIFISFWLFFNFLFMLALLFTQPVFGLILLVFFIIGLFALRWMLQTRRFFKYFVKRHTAIKAVRDDNPVVYIPQGNTAVERFLVYMRTKNRYFNTLVEKDVRSLRTPVLLTGETGTVYSFDAYVSKKSSFTWRRFGFGNPGYAFYVKYFESGPTKKEIMDLISAVHDLTEKSRIIPERIVALRNISNDEGKDLEDDLYDFIVGGKANIKFKGKYYRLVVQIVSEDADGTYDFIPIISETDSQPS
jgi:hypothetical protein